MLVFYQALQPDALPAELSQPTHIIIILELVIGFQQNLVPALLPIRSASELSLKIEYVHLNWLNGW